MSIDLTTQYGGLTLRSPVVIGACPLTAEAPTRIAIESQGAGALVLPSLFEEQVLMWNERQGQVLTDRDHQRIQRAREMSAGAVCTDAETYLAIVNRASSQASIPIIASLNGEDPSDWLDFAGQLQEAGANGIELSLHHPPPTQYAGPREVEDSIVEAVSMITDSITIPLYLKLNREYTSLSHMAIRLLSGAQGLVLFGRSPDLDLSLESIQWTPQWRLTPPGSVVHSLAAIMRVHAHCPAMPLAVSGGINDASDLIKALLACADVAMVTSAVYREGPDIVRTLLDGLIVFMERHRMRSIEQLQRSRPLQFDTEALRRQYMRALSSRLEPSEVASGNRTMHGDRWATPAAPAETAPRCDPLWVILPGKRF